MELIVIGLTLGCLQQSMLMIVPPYSLQRFPSSSKADCELRPSHCFEPTKAFDTVNRVWVPEWQSGVHGYFSCDPTAGECMSKIEK